MAKKIGLLFGGRSGEHEVSLASANTIAHHFDKDTFDVFPILISRDGRWYGPVSMNEIATAKAEHYADQELLLAPYPGGEILSAVTGQVVARLDAIFPIVHGTNGEDGILQGLLELAGVPYVGAGVAGSAIGMDKVLMRKILAYHQIPQVAFTTVEREQLRRAAAQTVAQIETVLSYPMFVKPANGGSSVGISKVKNNTELLQGLTLAAQYDRKLLIEQGIDAREIEIAVLGNGEPQVSLPGEIQSSNEFYDYKAKYIDNKSIAVIPAALSQEKIVAIQTLAKQAYSALDCEGLARVDFFIDRQTDAIYLNEINTLPGFTEISMYPKMWEAAGLPISKLLSRLVELAEARYADRCCNMIQ